MSVESEKDLPQVEFSFDVLMDSLQQAVLHAEGKAVEVRVTKVNDDGVLEERV